MELFIISFVVIGLAMAGMAASVLFGRSELKGTCASLGGGVGTLKGCEICPHRHREGMSKPVMRERTP